MLATACLAILAGSLVGSFVTSAAAEPLAARWDQQRTPARGAPRSIGDYSAGCVQGARALPLDGAGYQVMHPSRLRYFGHPQLVDFVRTLGRGVRAHGLGDLLVGDLSQPRGGRAPGGHASHQTGLDVDLWYWRPAGTTRKRLDAAQRESLAAQSVLDAKTHAVRKDALARVTQLLQLTAADPRVERIFVHPIIKRELCAQAAIERAWLGKLRPWYGHDDHFHVRLACPSDSPACTPQTPQAAGDGCAELAFWFDAAARAEREAREKEYQSKVARTPALPAQCARLLEPVEAAAARLEPAEPAVAQAAAPAAAQTAVPPAAQAAAPAAAPAVAQAAAPAAAQAAVPAVAQAAASAVVQASKLNGQGSPAPRQP